MSSFLQGFNNGFLFGMMRNLPFFGCCGYMSNWFGFPPIPIAPALPNLNMSIFNQASVFPAFTNILPNLPDFNIDFSNAKQNLPTFDTNFSGTACNFSGGMKIPPMTWQNSGISNLYNVSFTGKTNTQKTANEKYASNAVTQYQSPAPTGGAAKTVATAASFVGSWSSAAARSKFRSSGVKGGGWCVDFATYCAKNSLPNYPSDMVTSGTDTIISRATKHNCYKAIPSSNKSEWAKQNVKPGDILMTQGNGGSGKHAVVVKEVVTKPNGETVVKCYSGNDGGAVVLTEWPVEKGRYSPTKGGHLAILGVVNLEKFA